MTDPQTKPTPTGDVLEQNVSTLLESGGEAPKLTAEARTRMRAHLIARHGAEAPATSRRGLWFAGIGLAVAAATALIVLRVSGGGDAPVTTEQTTTLADGSSWISEGSAKVTVLGERRVRVEGAALLDIAPGKGTFVVETRNGTIEVLGTRFLVDASAARTTTAVVRGQVKLASAAGEVLLHAGEQAVAEPGRPPVRGPAPRLSHLVSWAAEARRRAEHDVRPLRNGTLFARDPGVRNGQFGAEYPLPLRKLGIDIVVENQVARVALDQTFFNAEDRVLEGVYKFAIPSDAALQRLAMYVDGKLTESAVVERMRARRIYEELVYRRVDPALLEWEGTGKVSLRVYPLPARQEKRLMLAYTQSLAKLYGDWTLTVPLPQIDAPVGEVAFDVTLRGCANCEVTSTSHPISVTRKGSDAVVAYRKTSDRIGDSLVLHVRDARQTASVVSESSGGARYLMVRSPAELPAEARAYRPHTWVILDDVSASRGALERRAQQDLVDAFVRELDEEDRLAVIAFDVTARQKLAPTRVLDIDRRALRSALAGEGDVGATDIGVALDAATKLLAGTSPDDATIVYLGDGLVTSGPRKLDALRAQIVGKAQFVGVGVGDGADTQTLEALAAATGGYATTVDLADDLGWRAFDLVAALHTSRVTGLAGRLVDASGQLVPATVYVRSAQIADGEELEVVAKLAGDGAPAALELSGTANGRPWQQRVALADSTQGAPYLPRLWAHRHIAARLLAKHEPVTVVPCGGGAGGACKTEQEARDERDEAIRKEVVELGKQYFLLSRHTSLIVLENDAMYAQYGVRKGAGDTWAPYAMPERIPVVTSATTPANVADDAELVRAPIEYFYSDPPMNLGGAFESDLGWGVGAGRGNGEFGRGTVGFGTTGTTLGRRGHGAGGGGSVEGDFTRGDLDRAQRAAKAQTELADPVGAQQPAADGKPMPTTGTFEREKKATRIAASAGILGAVTRDPAWGGEGRFLSQVVAQRLTYPADVSYDDLTAFVPALLPDASDLWRQQLEDVRPAGTPTMEPAAKALLERARAALPSGVYRWGEREIAVDSARRFGWRRTTDEGLAETASFDGARLVRRYAELDLDVARAIASDDVALALGYLPIWIAEPAHYARYFDVKLAGARTVTLSSAAKTILSLDFDDQARLVAVRDGAGRTLVSIAWSAAGPVSARTLDGDLALGFVAQPIADAVAWAHGAASATTLVELPTRLPAFAKQRVEAEAVGSAAWRQAQRDYLASLAATNDRAGQLAVYDALRAKGGVSFGDLVLASGGLARGATDRQFAEAVAPLAATPVARYLIAGRAYLRGGQAKPEITTGLVGALWQLREITALFMAGKTSIGVDKLVAFSDRALPLRLIAASLVSNRYDIKPADIQRAWTSVAAGPYKNVARANAVMALGNRGAYDEAADMLALMIDDLDLAALPPSLPSGPYAIQQSRRGSAGWQMLWTRWRDRVLASTSYDHVLSLAMGAQLQPAEVTQVFARAILLAGDDADRLLEIANLALGRALLPTADSLVQRMLKKHETDALHQLAARIALQQGRTADALAHLEAAQRAGANEPVSIATVRAELAQIISTAKQLALQSTGADLDRAVERAMTWGAKWRAIDPGNPDIDRSLGELQLAVGNTAEAWRQLSGVIERAPMSGNGYITVAEVFEGQGRVAEALDYWQQAIVIEQTNPTPRVRKAQALIALGRTAEGDALLEQVVKGTWHDMWIGQVYQAKSLLARGKRADTVE